MKILKLTFVSVYAVRKMENFVMLMVLLVCVSLAALALGVLVAYAICRLLFSAFRHHVASHGRTAVAVRSHVAHSSI